MDELAPESSRMQPSPRIGMPVISPHFDNPPVVETSLGIQFDDIRSFTTCHFGLFYEEIRSDYPRYEDQKRLPPIVETFPISPRVPAFKITSAAGPERVWYKDKEDATAILQLQSDRIIFNWRDSGEPPSYPRYSANSRRCLAAFDKLKEFCRRNDLGDICPNLCEVLYVNRIWPIEGESAIDLFGKIFPGLKWQHSNDWLRSPEVCTFNRTYIMADQKGRLYSEASIGFDQKALREFILLRMTGRVLHREDESVCDNLQLAHDWVVQSFISLTDPAIREQRWGQTHDG